MSNLDLGSPNRADARREVSNRSYYEIRPLRYTVAEAAAALRCSRLYVYELMRRGLIRGQGTRRKIWVTRASLEAYVETLPDYQPHD